MQPTPAGERNRKIVFLMPTTTEDGEGTETEGFVDGPRPFAKVLYGTGSERRDAAAQGAVQSATFRVLASERLRAATERWRIRDDRGQVWGIGSISPIGRREIEFVATRIASQ